MSSGEPDVTRRTALIRLLRTCAIAAGLSAVETEKLLAQARSMKSLPDVTKLIGIPARDNRVKALKVLLMPKSRMAEVFRSEFGQEPQFVTRKRKPGGTACKAYVGGSACSDLECGIHVCGAATSIGITAARQREILKEVGDSDCISVCWFCFFCFASAKWGAELGADWLNRVKSDRFIRALFNEFRLTSADDLGRELRAMLQKRSEGL